MIKARACQTKAPPCPCYYSLGYSFLDLSSDTYSFYQYELLADDRSLLYVTLDKTYTKGSTDIFYGYLLINFEYHY